jgi:hypothetical protein
VLAGFFFRAKFHSNSLYVVEKKIVGISQYPYFSGLLSNWTKDGTTTTTK